MIGKSFAIFAASFSLLTASAVQAASADALSLRNSPVAARAASNAGDSSQLAGGSTFGFVLLAAVAGAMVWGLVEIVDDDDDADSN